MFNNEYEYLIHLIYCTIHDCIPQEPSENISLEKVFQFAKNHEVANISFVSMEKIQNGVNEELYKNWKTQYAFSIQRNINQENARNTIVCEFNKRNIRSTELQGTKIKQLYPYAFWRNMSDIDFVVDKQNLSEAEKALKTIGYVTKIFGDYDVSAFANPKIAVEVHTDFFDPNTEFFGKMTNPFKNAIPSTNDSTYQATKEDFFIYNILHCVKHYRGSGMGIRRIIDVYYLNKKILPDLDIEFTYDFFKQTGCKKDYEIISEIAENWFGDNAIGCNLDFEKNKIFMSGTHGNSSISMLNEYEREGKKHSFKIKKILKLIFPPKANIYSAYSFCSKKQLPIVFCWIYRWCVLIFSKSKRNHAFKTIKNIKDFKVKKSQS